MATARMQPDASGAAPAAEVWALVQSGQRVVARAAVEAMVRRQPADPEAHLLLGMLELDEGADESALEALRRATFLDAGNALAHFSLGRAYRRHNEPERARAALAHARRLIATLPDDLPVPGGGDLAAGELRLAVDAALKERP